MCKISKNIIDIIPSELKNLMESTLQDSIYHQEGSVWVHTLMVYEEIKKFDNLTPKELEILKYAAMLHDIGKIKTTKFEGDRITSKGHSRLSYHIAMEILDSIEMDFEDKLQILNLVRYHGNPYHVFSRDDLDREVITLSMQCN